MEIKWLLNEFAFSFNYWFSFQSRVVSEDFDFLVGCSFLRTFYNNREFRLFSSSSFYGGIYMILEIISSLVRSTFK